MPYDPLLGINPLSPEDASSIAEPPSLTGRIGEQLANTPSELGSDFTNLFFNLGVKSPEQTKPLQFPKPYEIPPAKTFGEGAVDVGASLARSLPLILSGEGAGAGIAEAAGAGKALSRIIGSAAGFGLQGATESPRLGITGAGVGAGFGAADVLPGKYKALAALGIFGLTGAESYSETQDPIKAIAMGLTNAALPFVLKGRGRDKPNAPEVPSIAPPEPPPGYGRNIGLTKEYNFNLEREAQPPEGALIREPIFSEDEAMHIAATRARPSSPTFRLDSEPELPLSRNSNGAVEPPSKKIQPPSFFTPEGSLVKDPTYTEAEANLFAKGKQPKVATLQSTDIITEQNMEQVASQLGMTKPGKLPEVPLLTMAIHVPEIPKIHGANVTIPIGATLEEVQQLRDAKALRFLSKSSVELDATTTVENDLLDSIQGRIKHESLLPQSQENARPPIAPKPPIPPKEPIPPRPPIPPKATINFKERLVTETEKTGEMYGPSKWTHVVDVTDEQGKTLGKIRGNVGDNSFTVKGANVYEKGKGTYQKIIRQLADKYGTVISDTDLQPAAEAAWKKVGGVLQEDGSYKFGKQVATLQPEIIPSFSFEIGSHVMADVSGEGAERGIIVGHDEASGTTQVKIGDDIHDVWTSKLKEAPKPTGEERIPNNQIGAGIGGMEEVAKAIEKPSGMKLRQRLGEIGATQQDIINKFARYIAAPIVGAGVGAAISDPDKRTQNALLFAIGATGLGHISPRLIEAFARSHPDIAKAGSFPVTIKEFAKAAGEAVIASEKATTRASIETGSATGFEKIARWLNRRFTTAPVVQKALDKAHGLVDDISKVIEKGQLTLSKIALTPGQLRAINDYYHGKVSESQFKNLVGDNLIYQSASAIRESANVLQRMVYKSLPEGALKEQVKNSFDKYITETFKIFHDPSYFPTEEAIQKAARELPGGSLENNVSILRDYLNSVQANKGIYSINRKGQGYGQALGAILSRKNPELSDAFKEMLGIYDSPLQQMAATADKLVKGGRTAEFFNQLALLEKRNGLKMSYTYEELASTRQIITKQLQHAVQNEPEKVATLQSKLQDLNSYLYNSANSQHGKFSNSFVDRRVHDSLMTYDSILTQSNSPINRAMTDITNAVKYAHTVASPLQFARQVFSMPFLGLLAKTGPADWLRAYNSLFNNPEELARLRRLGLTYGDTVSGMLRKDFSEMLKGKFDSLVTNRTIRQGIATWEEIYRTPDLITRISAFQKQESRLLRLGVAPAEATDRAIDFANTFAMNYGMAPKGIQVIRKVPFVNQYLTFAFEIARITKNLAKVALGGEDIHGIGRPYAIGVLTAFATAPMIIQKLTESQLSPKDLEDWKKAEALLPDYSRSNFKFVTHRDAKGNFHYVDFTPIIVHDKWMKMARDLGNLDWDAIKADNPVFGWENTPLLNVATNQITGQDIHTKEQLSTIGQRIDSIRRDILPPLIGTDFDKILKALTPNNTGGLGITDLRTGQTASIGSILGSYVTSLRDYTVSPTNLEQRAIADATTQTANARAYAYRIIRSDARQDIKDAARAYYLTVQKQILAGLRDKIRKQPIPDSNSNPQ